jgi:hypothetical protein
LRSGGGRLKDPDVYIGTADEIKWISDTDSDNDKLESTPKAVIQILGFDPAEDNNNE